MIHDPPPDPSYLKRGETWKSLPPLERSDRLAVTKGRLAYGDRKRRNFSDKKKGRGQAPPQKST